MPSDNQVLPHTPVSTAPALDGRNGIQYFYGRVNYWADVPKSELLKDIKACVANKVTGYIIEMAGWRTGKAGLRSKPNSRSYKKAIETIRDQYSYLHNLCIRNNMWLMVCVVNINALLTKLGNKKITATQLFNNIGKDLLAIVKVGGGQNIIIQPVSEYAYFYDKDVDANGMNESEYNEPAIWPKEYRVAFKKAYKFHRDVCDVANEIGCKTVLNSAPDGPFTCRYCDFAAYHPDKATRDPIKEMLMKREYHRCMVVSDNSPLIEYMNGGARVTKLNANCKQQRIFQWRNFWKNKGIAMLGYYDFKRKKHNLAAITAIGLGLKKTPPPTGQVKP